MERYQFFRSLHSTGRGGPAFQAPGRRALRGQESPPDVLSRGVLHLRGLHAPHLSRAHLQWSTVGTRKPHHDTVLLRTPRLWHTAHPVQDGQWGKRAGGRLAPHCVRWPPLTFPPRLVPATVHTPWGLPEHGRCSRWGTRLTFANPVPFV